MKIAKAIALMLFFSTFAVAQYAIEAGHKIGKIELAATRASVEKILGKPSGSYQVNKKYTGDYWQSDSGQTVRIFYQANKVVQISVTSRHFITPEQISTANSLVEVQAKYPNLTSRRFFAHGSGGSIIDYYDDIARGITFEFTSPGTEVLQFACYAIIVHQPGSSVIPDSDEEPSQ